MGRKSPPKKAAPQRVYETVEDWLDALTPDQRRRLAGLEPATETAAQAKERDTH